MRVAAIIIAYNPDKDLLSRNLLAIDGIVDVILLWQNSVIDFSLPETKSQIVLLGDKTNKFIAKPLNEALKWCQANGYEFQLTMDQDSVWEDFGGFLESVEQEMDDTIAIYSPNINWKFAKDKKLYDIESAITSGSLINVGIASRLGGFREDYEIYWVDGEFCHWCWINGYRVTILPEYNLVQKFGNTNRTLFGYTTANYSPTSYFYLIRNMLWMHREYKSNPSIKCILYTYLSNVRGIILGEKHKFAKLSKILFATLEGLFAKLRKRKK